MSVDLSLCSTCGKHHYDTGNQVLLLVNQRLMPAQYIDVLGLTVSGFDHWLVTPKMSFGTCYVIPNNIGKSYCETCVPKVKWVGRILNPTRQKDARIMIDLLKTSIQFNSREMLGLPLTNKDWLKQRHTYWFKTQDWTALVPQ